MALTFLSGPEYLADAQGYTPSATASPLGTGSYGEQEGCPGRGREP